MDFGETMLDFRWLVLVNILLLYSACISHSTSPNPSTFPTVTSEQVNSSTSSTSQPLTSRLTTKGPIFSSTIRPVVPSTSIADILPLLGPRTEVDVVGLLDRSQGVSKHNFYYFVHPFFESLLTQYSAVHRDFARSAVVSFARDATVDYDTISDPGAAITKCELFGVSPSPWDHVMFNNDPDIRTGTNISGALQHAVNILDAGRVNRPKVIQVILSPRRLLFPSNYYCFSSVFRSSIFTSHGCQGLKATILALT